MEITITHVTRMKEDRICVAGLTPEGQHVRPVPRGRHLVRDDALSLFRLGALVRLANPAARPRADMAEDVAFDLQDSVVLRQAGRHEVVELLDRVAFDSVCEAFQDPQCTNRSSYYVLPGSQHRSLAVVRADRARSIYPLTPAFTKLRFTYRDPGLPSINLPVTDLRCYPEAGGDWDIDAVIEVLRTVPDNRPAFACIGLSRPFQPYDDLPRAQWLQMNTLWPGRSAQGTGLPGIG